MVIEINGQQYQAYTSWHEVPLAKLVELNYTDDYYLALTGIDLDAIADVLPEQVLDTLLDARQTMAKFELAAAKPLTDIGARPLSQYIQALSGVKARNYHLAVSAYYDVQDNAYSAGHAWVEFAKAWTAYTEGFKFVEDIRFKGPKPPSGWAEKYQGMGMVFETANSPLDLDGLVKMDTDSFLYYHAYKLDAAANLHNWNYDRMKHDTKRN